MIRIDDRIDNAIKKQYEEFCVLLYNDAFGKIDIDPDFIYKIKTELVLDFDGTINAIGSPTLFEVFSDNLIAVNPKIRHRAREYKSLVSDIDNSPSDFTLPLLRHDEFLRDCDLKEWDYNEACRMTIESKEIKLVPYAFDAILKLGNMGCRPGINTGSPRNVAVGISKKKLGITSERIAGSEIECDKHGNFLRTKLNLGTNKAESMSRFYPDFYCNYSIIAEEEIEEEFFYVTDDLSEFEKLSIAKIGSWGGKVLHVGEQMNFTNIPEFVVNDTSIRKNMLKIIPHYKFFRQAKTFQMTHGDPRVVLFNLELMDQIKNIAQEEIYKQQQIKQFCTKVLQFVSAEKLFPALRTNIKSKIAGLEYKLQTNQLQTNYDNVSRNVNEILQLLTDNDPLPHVTEKGREYLKNIITLLH